ncbi:two-component regulator propeller domain-containing protein [Pontibacter akesuensis]|uniref:two-component regulator propeller domain-containing protein n=1 Tax=Pontibacter akesuensis TaxID=388950 RepID=UPI00155FA49B|nr:two-component regulator propeller domain-containing protein [Pontibacter akesuensis]
MIVLCLYLAAAVPALAQQYNIRNWTLEQGLPQSEVMAIQQDQQGYLWLATRAGLSRFNGTDFVTYTKEDGLSSHNISTLFLDSQQHLWIGTTDAGLLRFNGSDFIPYGAAQGLQAESIQSVSEDKTGRIWVASNTGVFFLSGNRMQKYTALPEGSYTSIAHTPSGAMLAGTEKSGLYRVSKGKLLHLTTENSELPSNHVTALLPQADAGVWIGTTAGLAQLTQNKVRRIPLPESLAYSHITSFTLDNTATLWIGLQRNGLLKYDGKSFEHLTRRNGLRTNRITALATDMENNIWIGTSGYGLQQYKTPWFVHFFDFTGLAEPRITALAQDSNGTLLLGTDEGDFARMRQQRPDWTDAQPWPRGTTIYSLLPDKEQLWVCSSNGVWRLTPNGSTHYAHPSPRALPDVYQAATGPAGGVFFATAAGIATLHGDSLQLLPATEGPIKAKTIYRDTKGRLWVGADKGVFQVREGQVVKVRTNLNVREISSITEDTKGNLYFAAFNQGLLLLQGRQAKLFTTEQGLPNEAIKTVFADASDNLWVATNRDVLKVSLPILLREGKFSYRSYTANSGFRGLEVCDNAIVQARDSSIWFGTTKGLTQYLPHLDHPNTQHPKVMLTDVMLYSRPTDWEELGYPLDSLTGLPETLRLPHTQNHLSFNFHAICLSGPEQVRYKYRLAGYEDSWSPATSRSFTTYANLSPGKYKFELLAQNNEGYWTEQPLSYEFAIVPPIWRREWFIGVLLVVIAGAILSVVHLRERSLVKMNTLLEMKVDHRTRLLERQNREKEILLQEIHHRVKNNLQIVMSMLNLQARHVPDPLAKDVMQALRSRVRSMALLHERLYRHNDLEQINLEDYFLEICESLYASYGISMERVALELDIPETKVDVDTAITLGLIVNELVSNTLKYAFPQGEAGVLRIVLTRHDEVQFTLTVSDNGRGLPEDFYQHRQQGHSFGLKLVESLSKKLEGHMNFYNSHGTKSTLYFVLPS